MYITGPLSQIPTRTLRPEVTISFEPRREVESKGGTEGRGQ